MLEPRFKFKSSYFQKSCSVFVSATSPSNSFHKLVFFEANIFLAEFLSACCGCVKQNSHLPDVASSSLGATGMYSGAYGGISPTMKLLDVSLCEIFQ